MTDEEICLPTLAIFFVPRAIFPNLFDECLSMVGVIIIIIIQKGDLYTTYKID